MTTPRYVLTHAPAHIMGNSPNLKLEDLDSLSAEDDLSDATGRRSSMAKTEMRYEG